VPEPALRLMIGDKELRAIGHVAAQWAYLETQIDAVTHILFSQPSVQEKGLRQQQSFKNRMANLKDAASIALKEQEDIRNKIIKIADEASSLRGKRDQIVHSQWRLVRNKGGLKTGIEHTRQYPSFNSSTWQFTAEQAEDIACKISELNLEKGARLN
jgi:hypothetical protein